MRFKRAVGYCLNGNCDEVHRGVFLLNHSGGFKCPVCKKEGIVEVERGSFEGESNLWREVRVEFNFDPITQTYRDVAIVIDHSLDNSHNVYRMKTPLVKTDRRALRIAESLLATLHQTSGLEQGEIPRSTERTINFSDSLDEIKGQLKEMAVSWEGLKAKSNPPDRESRKWLDLLRISKYQSGS